MQETFPGSVTIKCLDGEVIEHPYVLMRCFKYFIGYYSTPMSTPEKPTIKFSSKAVRILLWYLFHKNNGNTRLIDTHTFSEIVEMYRCAEFLYVIESLIPELLFWLVTNSAGVYDEEITDLIIQNINMYTYQGKGKLLNVISATSIVRMIQDTATAKHLTDVYTIDIQKAYEIWKQCGYEYKLNTCGDFCKYLTVDDFIACYKMLETLLHEVNGYKFNIVVKLLKRCHHLKGEPELKKYWKFLDFII